MSVLRIEGGNPLNGTVQISGNKNAILPMIAATFLTDQEVVFSNVPAIRDVAGMLEIATQLGARVERDGDQLSIQAQTVESSSISKDLCSRIRTSIMFVGPLLYRTGKATLFPPGGDVIGRRRLDTHFYGLEKLGAIIEADHSFGFTLSNGFQGDDLFFDEASVTATEHILMAAVIAEGKTILRNVASEPHVQDLAKLLVAMGAKIEGVGTNQMTVEGVSSLHGAEHRVCSDHIEAASFLAIAAATRGNIKAEGIEKSHYWMARRVFETLGVQLELNSSDITLSDDQTYKVRSDLGGKIPVIDDGPWPAFPSDMMSCMIILASQVEGATLFFEKMFESRLYFVDKLLAMGANAVVCDPHRVVILGRSRLRSTTVSSPDIRAGMALIGAALCATGTSQVQNIQMIDRGYERVEQKLQSLGAKVSRVSK